MRSRVCLVVLVVAAGALLAGCGGSSGSSSSAAGSATPTTTAAGGSAASSAQPGSSGRASTSSTATSASGSPASAKPAQLSSGTVATVAGTPITTAAYTHWLSVSAPATVKPLIADASDYSGCIAAVKSRETKTEKLIKTEEENFAKKSKGRAKESGLLSRERKPKTEAQRRQQCKLQYKAFKQQAASTLIRRLQTQVQAKELGIDVSEAEVAKQLKVREASQKALAKNPRSREFLAEAAHYTGADLKEMVTSQLLESQIDAKTREKFTKTGSISQGEMEKYFNEHKQIYAQPESRSIVFAISKSQSTAEAVAKDHLSGGVKASAAKHGITATPTTLGCAQSSAGTGSQASLVKSICAAKTGVVSGPVKSSVGSVKAPATYYVFEVKSTTPATQPSFAQEKERIKQLLGTQGQEQGTLKYNEEARAKLKAQTECAAGYVVALCKEYVAP
jgi:hypothetical protein